MLIVRIHKISTNISGAIEKQKLVYILNRDSQARLTISSPLEAHKANTLTFHTVGVDVGFDNPVFACLEVDYEVRSYRRLFSCRIICSFSFKESDNDPTGQAGKDVKQSLTFYELDLGLNHVVRKYSEPLDKFANTLITVPGGTEGPSGVLVCSENYITFKNVGDQPDIRCPIPRRRVNIDECIVRLSRMFSHDYSFWFRMKSTIENER
jgi:splicing factor 3B subunit 3